MHKVCLVGVLLVSILASFARAEEKPAKHTLTISVVGFGKVVGEDINCSTACRIDLHEGFTVALKAVPATEWHFVGWGGTCKGTGECSILMDGNKAVEAVFTYP